MHMFSYVPEYYVFLMTYNQHAHVPNVPAGATPATGVAPVLYILFSYHHYCA